MTELTAKERWNEEELIDLISGGKRELVTAAQSALRRSCSGLYLAKALFSTMSGMSFPIRYILFFASVSMFSGRCLFN